GFRAPSYSFSKHTLGLLLDEGFAYDASLKGDDIPYALSDGRRTLVELPSDLSLDDWTQYVCLKDFGYMLPIASPQRAMEVFRAEFDAAWKYGALWIAVWHPFVSGRMSRADAIAGLIEHMQEKGGVCVPRRGGARRPPGSRHRVGEVGAAGRAAAVLRPSALRRGAHRE